MDTYDYIAPTPIDESEVYILELELSERPRLLKGIFDHLETALHAMNHLRSYEFHQISVGQSLIISQFRKNSIHSRSKKLVSWERLEGKESDEAGLQILGTTNGKIRLHDQGFRTHRVEE